MRVAACFTTFNRPAVLKKTLEQILRQTRPPDSVLVVDNGNLEETRTVVEQLAGSGLIYHPMEKNVGPAGASALAFRKLSQQGFDWIYWGDDDDPPQFPDTLERVLDIAKQSSSDVAGVGAVGALFDWRTGESVRLSDYALKGVVDVDTIGGNSHLVLRSAAIRSIGVPDERLFFGYYEPEYCLRIKKAGYRLQVDGDLMWRYREINGRLNFNRRRKYIPDYSYDFIWRRYYRTRNYIFMMRNTFQRPDLARRETMKAMGRALFSWRRGFKYGSRFTKLQMLAIRDGYYNRMGRTILPVTKLKTTDVTILKQQN
ncbi:glycosyltransferase [bacterium]|nr:glycosyltransferase [bacterium]